MLGVNDYFGWYPGTNGAIADRELLSAYLDELHALLPDEGADGQRVRRRGQPRRARGGDAGRTRSSSDFVRYHLGVYAPKPWLSGAIYWALQEFRVRPGWDGGNPRAEPPIHQKGVVTFDGAKKPAFNDLQQSFLATAQFGPRAQALSARGRRGVPGERGVPLP